jgi:hypothetical protein
MKRGKPMIEYKVNVFDPDGNKLLFSTMVKADSHDEAKAKVLESFKVWTFAILEKGEDDD